MEENQSPEYPNLDALIGGLIKQDLIVIAARVSMGKTWLACYLANHIAVSQKLPVVFFSIEQDLDLGLLLYRDEYYNSETKDKGVVQGFVRFCLSQLLGDFGI